MVFSVVLLTKLLDIHSMVCLVGKNQSDDLVSLFILFDKGMKLRISKVLIDF